MHYLDPLFIVKTLGLLGIVIMIFAESGLFFGFFLPGDSLLFTAGLLASQGYLNIASLLILTFIAAVLGDNVGYAFGKKTGPALFKKEDSFFFKQSYLEKTARFYETHGKKALILARFTPIVRTFVPIFAGIAKMNYRTFFIYNLLGGFLWTFSLILLGYFLGGAFPQISNYLTEVVIVIVVVSFIPSVVEIMRGGKN